MSRFKLHPIPRGVLTLASWLIAASTLFMPACGGDDADQHPASPCSGTLKAMASATGRFAGVAVPLSVVEDPVLAELAAQEFNAMSPEGEVTWQAIHQEPDRWNFRPADAVIAFAERNRMSVSAPHLLWDQLFNHPAEWVLGITDPEEMRRVVRDHIETVMTRYAGRIARWNVVNEPHLYFTGIIYPNVFWRVLGKDYIAEAFRIAASVDSGAELWLNEIFTEYSAATADGLVNLTSSLLSQGLRVDGVGLQGHIMFGEPDYQLVDRTMRRLGDLGVKVDLSEVDMPLFLEGEEPLDLQAEVMARLVGICLDVPACQGVIWWGLHDGLSWYQYQVFNRDGLRPLLLAEDLSPKPAYLAVKRVFAEHLGCAATVCRD